MIVAYLMGIMDEKSNTKRKKMMNQAPWNLFNATNKNASTTKRPNKTLDNLFNS